MTPEQEKRGAELFAAGASEREVATELKVSASSAHRLKERLEVQQTDVGPSAPDGGETVLQAADGILSDEALAILQAERDRLAAEVENLNGRAAASLSARQALERERDRLLLETGDASSVRQRLIDAGNDLYDWGRSIELHTAHLGEVDARIAELLAERQRERREAAAQAALAAAIEMAGELVPAAREALRGAVLSEVPAGELVRVAGLLGECEHIAGRSWDAEVVPPLLPSPRDPWGRAVVTLWGAAKAGDTPGCNRVIAALGGVWVDRDPDEFARMHADVAEKQRALNDPSRRLAVPAEQPSRMLPATVGLDAHGRAVPPDRIMQPAPIAPHRHPSGLPVWR